MVLPLLWVLLAALALVLGWTTGTAAFSWVAYLMLLAWIVGAIAARMPSAASSPSAISPLTAFTTAGKPPSASPYPTAAGFPCSGWSPPSRFRQACP